VKSGVHVGPYRLNIKLYPEIPRPSYYPFLFNMPVSTFISCSFPARVSCSFSRSQNKNRKSLEVRRARVVGRAVANADT
jgi:hypothetical protein